MTFWLYTESEAPLIDGPFFSEDDVMISALWEFVGVCLWCEEHTGHGWRYENVKWTEGGWFTTSAGERPVEPERPAFLLEGQPVLVGHD